MSSFDAAALSRPDRSLLKYYIVCSLLTGPLSPFLFLPLFFKYETLKYRFDDDGVSMSWGILFRKEIYLTYRRIQDIHVTRNILQRWMGLATVALQTASGTSGAEMSIEGILAFDALRDFLYQKMRGAKGTAELAAAGGAPAPTEAGGDEALALLREIRDALGAIARQRGGGA